MADSKDILSRAIQKAIDNGWYEILPTETWEVVTDRGLEVVVRSMSPYTGNEISRRYDYMELIYRHDFAKVLWREPAYAEYMDHDVPAKRNGFRPWDNGFEDWSSVPEYYWYCINCKRHWRNTFDSYCERVKQGNLGWRKHLQRMVVSEDPIKYLEEQMDDWYSCREFLIKLFTRNVEQH